MFDVIERLKSDWTDKYVVIDSAAPELARFANATGVVRTVNMNGRCLVEFDQFNNVGWYDIDPSALKIVSQPRPKPVEKEAAKPAAAAKAPAAAKPAKPATSAKPAGGRPSTADILAAARGKAAPAAGKPEAPAGKRPSTAEILAQARAAKAAAPAAEPPAAEADAGAPAAEAPQARPAGAKPAAAKPAAGGPLPTTTADKIAWCRAHDGT
jgi:hypothetical protein